MLKQLNCCLYGFFLMLVGNELKEGMVVGGGGVWGAGRSS